MTAQDRETLERAFAQLCVVVGDCTQIERTTARLVKECARLSAQIDQALRGEEQLLLPLEPRG